MRDARINPDSVPYAMFRHDGRVVTIDTKEEAIDLVSERGDLGDRLVEYIRETNPEEAIDILGAKLNAEERRARPVWDRLIEPTLAHWKDEIDIVVDDADVPDVEEAIGFFTATEATLHGNDDGTTRVTSIGYRRGPAGDH